MKTKIRIQIARGHLGILALVGLLAVATGCLPDQQATGGDAGTLPSELVMGAIAIAGDFARALLAAFLF